MGWFGSKNKDDSSKSVRKEPLTGGGRSTSSRHFGAASTYTNSSYVAPTTTNDSKQIEQNSKYNSSAEQGGQRGYSQQEGFSDDIEDQDKTIQAMGTDVDRQHSDDEELVMIDKAGDAGGYHGEETVHDASRSFSQAEETEGEGDEPIGGYNDASKRNHLNSLFNGHLMKWKFEAEEGSGFIRVPACKLKTLITRTFDDRI